MDIIIELSGTKNVFNMSYTMTTIQIGWILFRIWTGDIGIIILIRDMNCLKT